jgi:predicted HicB family RNase H-like nuclease
MAGKQTRKKSATLSLRIDNELKAAAELAAAADRRSLTAHIERLIEKDLRERTAVIPIGPHRGPRR